MDEYHPAPVFAAVARLDDCNELGPHLDVQFYAVSSFSSICIETAVDKSFVL